MIGNLGIQVILEEAVDYEGHFVTIFLNIHIKNVILMAVMAVGNPSRIQVTQAAGYVEGHIDKNSADDFNRLMLLKGLQTLNQISNKPRIDLRMPGCQHLYIQRY